MTAPQRAVFYLLLAALATVTALILLDARPAGCGQPAPDTWEPAVCSQPTPYQEEGH